MPNVFAKSTANESSLVQKIVDKFGLNKADVQGVFDQFRTDKQTAMEKKFEDKLSSDVKQGKITEAQKQLIIAKVKELAVNKKTQLQDMKNKTPQQRKAAMLKERQALLDWAKQNGINPSYLMPRGFGRMGKHM